MEQAATTMSDLDRLPRHDVPVGMSPLDLLPADRLVSGSAGLPGATPGADQATSVAGVAVSRTELRIVTRRSRSSDGKIDSGSGARSLNGDS